MARAMFNSSQRLSDRDVEDIRFRYHDGERSQKELADEYGVTQAQVSRIVRGVQRKEAGGPISTYRRKGM